MRQAEDRRCENREAGKAEERGEAETGAGSGAEPTGSAGTAKAGPGKGGSRLRIQVSTRPTARQAAGTDGGGGGEEPENPSLEPQGTGPEAKWSSNDEVKQTGGTEQVKQCNMRKQTVECVAM